MEPHRVSVVFILGVLMGFVVTATSLCFVRRTPTTKIFLYQCFRSNDYLADVNKAPIDIPRVIFTNSNIPVVRDGSFCRLKKSLNKIAAFHSNVEEIADNAFEGLTKLELLAFPGNKLRVVKSAWFKGLANLKDVSFQNNRIKHIDDKLFAILPPLEMFDISMNEIECLPTALFGNFKVKNFEFWFNRLKPLCEAELISWMKDRNITVDHNDSDYYLDPRYLVTKICVDKLAESQMNEAALNSCINATARALLPAKGNYTVKQMCEMMKDKKSPFLDCDK